MKKIQLLTILMVMLAFNIFAQNAARTNAAPGRPVKAYLNYSVFYSPKQGPYIETYLTVMGRSVFFKKDKQKFQGKVRIEINFFKDTTKIVSNAYNVLSTEIIDTSNRPNFIDLQRYWLKPGDYKMQIAISDANKPTSEPLSGWQDIKVKELPADSVAISDIELLESFNKTENQGIATKSGYEIIPYVLRYYPEAMTRLAFYAEGYNTMKKLGPDSRFVYVYYIEGAETKEKVPECHTFLKQKSAEVNPLLNQFDISQLPSGEYNLVVEIRNGANELLAEKKVAFSRMATSVKYKISDIQTIDTTGTFISRVNNLDTLKDYISCLWPISSTTERDWQYNQIKNADSKIMQQYLYAFWVNREPKEPEKAWKTYRAQAAIVKKSFACGKIPGYMTDRGRVYLQYGVPSAAQQVPSEPDSYPYEIWQYYRIKDPTTGQFQSNKKFVFYNRQLDGKCFDLIHSDARGETRDDRWQIKLKQRSNQIMNLDQTTPTNSTYGSGANDLFQNPR